MTNHKDLAVEELEVLAKSGDSIALMWLTGHGYPKIVRYCLENVPIQNPIPLMECLIYFDFCSDVEAYLPKIPKNERIKSYLRLKKDFITPEEHHYDDREEYLFALDEFQKELLLIEDYQKFQAGSFSEEFLQFIKEYDEFFNNLVKKSWEQTLNGT